jgi:rsbT co-antagonist protein RsbR
MEKSATTNSKILDVLNQPEDQLVADWISELGAFGARSDALIKAGELRDQCGQFLQLFRSAMTSGDWKETGSPAWGAVRDFLGDVSRSRSIKGFTPSQTASFIFALKPPLLERLQALQASDAKALYQDVSVVNRIIDTLGLYTTEVHQKAREGMIARQQQELLELSTPVVKLWDGILALPLIGTLDSARTQVVMESLLQKIVETGAPVSIIDITGVPTVDTLVAQHLLKTITAARLMGADCIISGMRPQIAQTIVHLGVELGNVVTKASLSDAFALALRRLGLGVKRDGNKGMVRHTDGQADGRSREAAPGGDE